MAKQIDIFNKTIDDKIRKPLFVGQLIEYHENKYMIKKLVNVYGLVLCDSIYPHKKFEVMLMEKVIYRYIEEIKNKETLRTYDEWPVIKEKI